MKRQGALDGLRGCAILWVLLYHYVALPAKAAAFSSNPGLLGFAGYGWVGVNLFFVLSGYLITKGLTRETADLFTFGNFWARRAFRIVPPYALLLVSFLAARAWWPATAPGADKVFNSVIPPWSYLVFAQNLYMAPLGYLGNDWLRVLWSLAVEVQFYLLISVALLLIPKKRVIPWLAALAAGSVAFRYSLYFSSPHPDAALVVLLPCRLDAFLLGGLAALLHATKAGSQKLRTAAGFTLAGASAAFLMAYASGFFGRATPAVVPLYYTVISLGFVGLLDLCATDSRPLAWLMQARPLVEAGRLSYFIYLFHMPFALVFFHLALGSAPALGSPAQAAVMAGSFAAVCAAAWLSYTLMEAPLIRYAHTLGRRPRPVPLAAA